MEEYYEDLNEMLKNVRSTVVLIIMGYMNAIVEGKYSDTETEKETRLIILETGIRRVSSKSRHGQEQI